MPALTIDHVELENYADIAFGLIAPDGRLFNAEHGGGHSRCAGKMHDAGILPAWSYDGCVHIAYSDFDFARDMREYRRVTQAQLDTMFDYMAAKGGEFPWDVLEVV